jgi:hypothetical protein
MPLIPSTTGVGVIIPAQLVIVAGDGDGVIDSVTTRPVGHQIGVDLRENGDTVIIHILLHIGEQIGLCAPLGLLEATCQLAHVALRLDERAVLSVERASG